MIKNLKNLVIEPILKKIGLYSPEAVEMVYGIICVESNCGEYLSQLGNGPARGICQMEMATYNDIYENFLKYRPELMAKVEALRTEGLSREENMIMNLAYQVAMCRVCLLRYKGAIPKDLEGQSQYWKKNYNTEQGKGKIGEYKEKYNV